MRFFLALLVSVFATSAHAVFADLTIDPRNPTEGQAIGFTITTGGCDQIQVDQLNASDSFRTVTIVGHQVDVTVSGLHEISTNLCMFPLATPHFSVGALPQGSYTFNLHFHDFAGSLVPQNSIVASTTFAVSAPAPIPATNAYGVVFLVLGLIALATCAREVQRLPRGRQ